MLIFLIGLFVLTPLRALVLSSVWGWFVVPLGVPSIGLAHAWGIGLTVSLLTNDPTKPGGEHDDWQQLFLWFVFTLLVWALAWAAHLLM